MSTSSSTVSIFFCFFPSEGGVASTFSLSGNSPLPLFEGTLLLSISACRLILLTIFFQLVTNRSSSQRVSVSTASISSSISSPSCSRCPFLFLMICTTCSIFSGGKICNPSPNLCFSSTFISLLFGSLAFGLGCFKGFTGSARIGEGIRTGD
uniref:Transmembrane protein n=1 Tax=Medicago truncatula TaxID=3880 RepID=I3S1R0_MEDTR|nr:unknown [Medicago truncatula]